MNTPLLGRLRRERRARQAAERLRRLPARVLAELLLAIDAAAPTADVLGHAWQFSEIDPDALRIAGGDRFPAPPLRIVPSDLGEPGEEGDR